MEKIIPVFYSSYGRYITKHRAIPGIIDCLKPVERRILLCLFEKAKDKKVKSAKVIGHAIGTYHPHGDLSCYGTLINLVKQKYAIGQGNWGSPGLVEDATAAAARYTEVKLEKWVKDLAFQYHKFVPWEEIELESEPLYLPSPVPIGLIGEGIIQGISFHRTIIPKYKLKDLLKRCIHLIEGGNPKDNIIQPAIKGCSTQEINNDYLKLLTSGEGEINIIPDGNVTKKYIEVFGRSPMKTFKNLIKAASIDPKTKKKKIEVHLDDLCDKDINIRITPIKIKTTNLNNLVTEVWTKYLISKTRFVCYVCNNKGLIDQLGIDELIKTSYEHWKLAVLNKTIYTFNKLNEKKFEYHIIEIIRYIFEQYKSHKIEDIKNYYIKLCNGKNQKVKFDSYDANNKVWSTIEGEIDINDIENTCKKKTIQALIEHKLNMYKIDQELNSVKKEINNNDINCLNTVKSML